jgi:hypothetical protein
MISIGNLVRVTRGQGWRAEDDPGLGIVVDVRCLPYLLDEIKVQWEDGRALWENSAIIAVISRG